MTDAKITIFIMMSTNLRRKTMIFVNLRLNLYQLKSMIDYLQLRCWIKEPPFPFTLTTCSTWITIHHLKYFMLTVVNMFVSFYYWKRSLGNALKLFISLQIQLMNLSSSFLCNYFYLCVSVYFICIYMYMYVFYVCYLCLDVFRLQCICVFNWCEHLDTIGTW